LDTAAGAAARRYARSNVVTARVDEMQFLYPIFVNAFVTCTATVAYVGNTSMEVIVTVDVEDLETEDPPIRAQSAFFTMVALDKTGKPKKVPPLVLETEEEKRLCSRRAAKAPGETGKIRPFGGSVRAERSGASSSRFRCPILHIKKRFRTACIAGRGRFVAIQAPNCHSERV
jgi:acyl-CoA hydrolase